MWPFIKAKKAEPSFGDILKESVILKLQQGDTLVLSTDGFLTLQTKQDIKDTLRKVFPTFPPGKIVVLEGGMRLDVVRGPESDERKIKTEDCKER